MSKYTHLATRQIGYRLMGLAMICVITAGMLISSQQLSRPADEATVDTHIEDVAVEAEAPRASGGVAVVAPKTPAKAAAAFAPAVAPAAEEEGSDPGDRSFQGQTLVKEPAAKLAAVTITGCLERADETTFRLKDTVGEDAPRSRSWKSVFLKKGSASIEVVDAAHRLKLADHVGEKVSVTGTLVDREMQVRSLSRVATSCANSPKVRV